MKMKDETLMHDFVFFQRLEGILVLDGKIFGFLWWFWSSLVLISNLWSIAMELYCLTFSQKIFLIFIFQHIISYCTSKYLPATEGYCYYHKLERKGEFLIFKQSSAIKLQEISECQTPDNWQIEAFIVLQ